jgi:hypothetical protein
LHPPQIQPTLQYLVLSATNKKFHKMKSSWAVFSIQCWTFMHILDFCTRYWARKPLGGRWKVDARFHWYPNRLDSEGKRYQSLEEGDFQKLSRTSLNARKHWYC